MSLLAPSSSYHKHTDASDASSVLATHAQADKQMAGDTHTLNKGTHAHSHAICTQEPQDRIVFMLQKATAVGLETLN